MESFQYSPSFSDEKIKSSHSFWDAFFSGINKSKRQRGNGFVSDFENWFNFSFIMAASLFLAGGLTAGGLGLWRVIWRWMIPKTMHPKQDVFVATPCLALVVAIFSPVIAMLSCIKYHEGRNQKPQILLPAALGFVSIILMLIGASMCFQFRSSLSEDGADFHSMGAIRNSDAPWLRDFAHHLSLRLNRSFPGTKEREEWETVQKLILCCGVHGYTDWFQTGKETPIPTSCCVDNNRAPKLASDSSKEEGTVCCQMSVLDCKRGKCGSPVPFFTLSEGTECFYGSIAPMGCFGKIILTLRDHTTISGNIFLVCVAIYVIAEIIMGIFLFI